MNKKGKKKWLIPDLWSPTCSLSLLMFLVLLPMTAGAQRILTLDSCRAMALKNNKQIGVAMAKQEVNTNLRKSARTQYLPKVNALGGYLWMNKEISILNDDQKSTLNNMGTNLATGLQNALSPLTSALPATTQAKMAQDMAQLASTINQVGAGVVDAFRTDTRHTVAGSVMVTQPVYMGGAIVAANKMAEINEEMAANSLEMKRQLTLYNVDHAYWQVMLLRYKEKLAESYVELVRKLKGDVQKMIDQGMATKGDGLTVSVRVNEAEMALMQVNDGLALAKMLLCQLCGLPEDEEIEVSLTPDPYSPTPDPSREGEGSIYSYHRDVTEEVTTPLSLARGVGGEAFEARPELKLLQNTVDITKQTTNVLKATNLPQVVLTGGYILSNPNNFNGFEKKFAGVWNLGVLVRVPIWNWGDVKYKVRASKGATAMANLELDDARELINLQVRQSNFKVKEAQKKLLMAQSSVANADENLRMANLAFKEGTASYTVVMEAQTAWQLAQSQMIDAQIGVRLSQVELQKALGTLTAN